VVSPTARDSVQLFMVSYLDHLGGRTSRWRGGAACGDGAIQGAHNSSTRSSQQAAPLGGPAFDLRLKSVSTALPTSCSIWRTVASGHAAVDLRHSGLPGSHRPSGIWLRRSRADAAAKSMFTAKPPSHFDSVGVDSRMRNANKM
jgi:hypothetical protein